MTAVLVDYEALRGAIAYTLKLAWLFSNGFIRLCLLRNIAYNVVSHSLVGSV
ncbi:unknown [Prevotella sp. CAG:1185]|nr:unknown [Prevotella sp. CAG:1185]